MPGMLPVGAHNTPVHNRRVSPSPPAEGARAPGAEHRFSGSVTRGFLFADLRGYTTFTEARGATAAVGLLDRYRRLVRAAIERFEGAEIRTEGDSFYVVFGSVSAAVRCGLAIVEAAAAEAAEHPHAPIQAGIGIHAGETVETPDGYVGAPVNLAARICAQARPGEVLVSDTVRALTHTMLPVRFEPRGRRQLKGVAEPVALFLAVPTDPDALGVAPARRSRWQRLSRRVRIAVVAGAGALVLGLGVLGWAALRPSGLPAGPWRIAVSLPLTGDLAGEETLGGAAMRDAVKLAVDEANAEGGIGDASIELAEFDAARDEELAFERADAVSTITDIVNDPRVVAVVGPLSSFLAMQQIPVTNEAGLLQCSPSATGPWLTKPRDGALDHRAAAPDRINFVRPVAADDINATAMADFAFNDLGVERVLVVDDWFDIGVADNFDRAYQEEGGQVVRRTLNEDAEPATVLEPWSVAGSPPEAVFFGGFTDSGGPQLRLALADAGHGDLPFLSWDGIFDGSGADPDSFIGQAGEAAAGSYLTHSGVPTPSADFVDRFRAAYGAEPSEYTGAAFACAEVILESLRAVAETGPSADALREAVRAYAVDPEHRYETVSGTFGFDENGDSTSQFVQFYRVEMSAAGGEGDWVIEEQRNYAPAP